MPCVLCVHHVYVYVLVREKGRGRKIKSEREREREKRGESSRSLCECMTYSVAIELAKGLWCNISFVDSPMPYMGMAALIVGFLMDKQHSCGCQHS